MARRNLHRLNAAQVSKLTSVGRHADGGGLYLSIGPEERRRWVFLYVRRGRRVELGLGGGRELSLAQARAEAAKFRGMLAAGTDPKVARECEDQSQSFGDFADAYVETMRHGWRSEKHASQWTMTLETYAKSLRSRSIGDISTQDILDVLTPLWRRIPVTAKRLQARLENVLDAARAKGLRSGENPARWRGHLDQLLPKNRQIVVTHHAALPYESVPGFISDLRRRSGIVAAALQFTVLTACRTTEVLGATWDEVDLTKKIWIISAERMKAGKEHRVPLSATCLEILAIRHKASSEGLIFPGGQSDKSVSSAAMAQLLRLMRGRVTVHGFRSSFRDWASECTDFSSEVCEMALAHTIHNKVEAAYRRGDLFEKRKLLMEAWAAYCAPKKKAPTKHSLPELERL